MKRLFKKTGRTPSIGGVQFFTRYAGTVRKRSEIVDQNLHGVLRIILIGTFVTFLLLTILLLVSFLGLQNAHVLDRVVLAIACLALVLVMMLLLKKGYFKTVTWSLITFYTAITTFVLFTWGIGTPVGVLMLGCIILLVGSIAGTRYVIPATLVLIAILSAIQAFHSFGIPSSNEPFKSSTFWDVISYATIFIVFSLLSWLSRRRLEQALDKVIDAETALKKEKSLLAVRLKQKTKSLQEAQLKEMRQLYHFAELGRISAAALHELSNRLSVLTLDIDDIEQQKHQTEAINRVKDSVHHLEELTKQTHKQLNNVDHPTKFNVPSIVDETLDTLNAKAKKLNVSLHSNVKGADKKLSMFGDPLRLAQIVGVLVANAIESYETVRRNSRRTVQINTSSTPSHIIITVTDFGGGITKKRRQSLFTPLKTDKKDGLGIGLFIANEIVKYHFKGSITLDPRTDQTSFVVLLPKTKAKK